ncbi:MAG: hypothetical protein ABEK36_04565 [Candidatus Aenigmatarchaeota archaeon]
MKDEITEIVKGTLIILSAPAAFLAYAVVLLFTGEEEMRRRRRARILNRR